MFAHDLQVLLERSWPKNQEFKVRHSNTCLPITPSILILCHCTAFFYWQLQQFLPLLGVGWPLPLETGERQTKPL